MIALNTTLCRTSNAASRDIAGEVIILSAKDSMLHSLNELGTTIWKLLEKPRRVEEIVSALLEEYDVERAVLEKDVVEFLNDLMERKLVQICS